MKVLECPFLLFFSFRNLFIYQNSINMKKNLMKDRALGWFCVCMVMMMTLLSSCSKEIMLEDDEPDSGTSASATSTLVVKTRVQTANGANATVSFPVHVYVFSSKGSCVATTVISSADENMSMKLAKGLYHVYAVAGATDDAYQLPDQASASTSSVMELREGKNHGELMVAQSTVSLGKDQTNTLTIALKRKVMQLQSVVFDNIPTGVTSVSLAISPLYANVKLDGTYAEGIGSQTVNLTRDSEDNRVWRLEAPVYLLEASGEASLTVSLTEGDQVKSYTYVSKDELKANYKINIKGTYNDEFELSGTIRGEEWAGEKTIEFDLTDDTTPDTPLPDTPSEEPSSYGVPVVGQLYADGQCYVVSRQDNGDGSISYLLMTTQYGAKVVSTETEPAQDVLKGLVDKRLEQLAVKGISGWHLPTKEELTTMKGLTSGYSALVDKANIMTEYQTYFYQKTDGAIGAIRLSTPDTEAKLFNGLTRAFTTLTLTE